VNNPICEFRAVERRYRDGDAEVFAVRSISLTVQPGEFVAVMGSSGSGKSTLLNLAGGLESPTAGAVYVAGHDLSKLSITDLAAVRRRHVGYIFQRLNLLPTLTALENVMMPLELDGVRPKEAQRQAIDALVAAGIGEQANRYPDNLSGGQQQRVAVARAIVGERTLILADEPTGALDTTTGERVMDLLATQCEQGRAVILVTHEPRFASYADRVINLRDGLLVDARERVKLGAVS
jgi:putative ABC transport system ATP-binding protein